MTERYYLVRIPGPKDGREQVYKADFARVSDGSLILYNKDPEVVELLLVAFAPGRWVDCRLGVAQAPKPTEAAPNAT